VALITGRYQYRLAVGLEEPLSTRAPRKIGLPPDHPTLPSILKGGRLSIRTDRQMAFGHIARFRPAAERLRRFLWLPQRRGRLLHARIRAAWKYLKILDNTFLFDVAQDPMERANLKERSKDVYDRLVAQWNEWNSGMLPLDPQSFTGGFTGAQLADHFGAKAND
jgi:hypothetical protein